MNVQAIRPGPAVAAYEHWERQLRAGGSEPEPTPANIETDEPPASSRPSDSIEREHDRPAEGVLRLIQQGHFKGVAEARLRVNFSQELNNASKELSEFGDRMAALADDLAMVADTLPAEYRAGESGRALTKALEAFDASAAAAGNRYSGVKGRDAGKLRAALDAAFDGLKSAVSEILMPSPAAASDEGTLAAPAGLAGVTQGASQEEPEYPREIPSELAVFMSEMTRTFQNAMDKLEELTRYGEHLAGRNESESPGAYGKVVTEYSRHRSGSIPAADSLDLQG